MEKGFNYNTEVDNLTKINEFFQNAETPTAYNATETQDSEKIHSGETKSA